MTAFLGIFQDLGLSLATVQKAELTHAQVSTLLWINLGFGVVLSEPGPPGPTPSGLTPSGPMVRPYDL